MTNDPDNTSSNSSLIQKFVVAIVNNFIILLLVVMYLLSAFFLIMSFVKRTIFIEPPIYFDLIGQIGSGISGAIILIVALWVTVKSLMAHLPNNTSPPTTEIIASLNERAEKQAFDSVSSKILEQLKKLNTTKKTIYASDIYQSLNRAKILNDQDYEELIKDIIKTER